MTQTVLDEFQKEAGAIAHYAERERERGGRISIFNNVRGFREREGEGDGIGGRGWGSYGYLKREKEKKVWGIERVCG